MGGVCDKGTLRLTDDAEEEAEEEGEGGGREVPTTLVNKRLSPLGMFLLGTKPQFSPQEGFNSFVIPITRHYVVALSSSPLLFFPP